MKQTVEKRKPSGIVDYIALALTTFGVGYIPGAPGTYGSVLGVGIFLLFDLAYDKVAIGEKILVAGILGYWVFVAFLFFILILSFAGIWASGRSIELLGNSDPSQAVVDEVIGQLVAFIFIPFGVSRGTAFSLASEWPFIIAGFLLFRLFDIWKPFPIRTLEVLPGGLGICADDIVAGVYAGICLAVGYVIYLAI